MSDIAEAKQWLPLPRLMHQLGLREHAKKSARCPFHDDKHNSFSVYKNGRGEFRFKCHAGCGEGDEITFLELHKQISNSDATKLFLEMAGGDGSPSRERFVAARAVEQRKEVSTNDSPTATLNSSAWQECVECFTNKQRFALQIQRGYSHGFCCWLKENALIGIFEGCFAFPVHDDQGNVVAVHCFPKDGQWFYEPLVNHEVPGVIYRKDGTLAVRVRPLVIGRFPRNNSIDVDIFESQGDAFAFVDRTGERSGIFITRGCGNGALVKTIPRNCVLYAWKQNDESKNGKRAGDEWLKAVVAHAEGKVLCPKTPEQFKDPNDWTRAGATGEDLLEAKRNAEIVQRPAPKVSVTSEPVELPPPPPPYVPPPLALLPSVLREYVHAAAESLNVDVSFILLPMLSALGSAIGNAHSILLKPGFVQPPVIWTAIIQRSGYLKSPAIEMGCFAVTEYEHELMRRNKEAQEIYKNDLAEWKAKKPSQRGEEPEPPPFLTCSTDDLTIEALADILAVNPRGVLVVKDEISHWFASFDQYRSHGRGSDVSRWLSLHTAARFALDRVTDKRHLRIRDPRVCITGGIQPKVLRRVLTEDFFERGLPARFLFAFPSVEQIRWSEATIPDDLRNAVLELFEKIWLLPPGHDDHGAPRSELLGLDKDAKSDYVAFFNECGECAIAADEREEAAWNKLSGYAARLALVGQVAHNPKAKSVTGNVMSAACELSHWFGNEVVRINGMLAESREQRELRELCEFIERRGGIVYEREVMQSFTRLKNNKVGTERELTALVKAGLGNWEPVPTTEKGGRPTRQFRLNRLPQSTEPSDLRGEPRGFSRVDSSTTSENSSPGSQENAFFNKSDKKNDDFQTSTSIYSTEPPDSPSIAESSVDSDPSKTPENIENSEPITEPVSDGSEFQLLQETEADPNVSGDLKL